MQDEELNSLFLAAVHPKTPSEEDELYMKNHLVHGCLTTSIWNVLKEMKNLAPHTIRDVGRGMAILKDAKNMMGKKRKLVTKTQKKKQTYLPKKAVFCLFF